MRLTKWGRRFLPAWTFMLGLLIGGLPGGLTSSANFGAVGLYLLLTAPVWVVGELLGRRYARTDAPPRERR